MRSASTVAAAILAAHLASPAFAAPLSTHNEARLPPAVKAIGGAVATGALGGAASAVAENILR